LERCGHGWWRIVIGCCGVSAIGCCGVRNKAIPLHTMTNLALDCMRPPNGSDQFHERHLFGLRLLRRGFPVVVRNVVVAADSDLLIFVRRPSDLPPVWRQRLQGRLLGLLLLQLQRLLLRQWLQGLWLLFSGPWQRLLWLLELLRLPRMLLRLWLWLRSPLHRLLRQGLRRRQSCEHRQLLQNSLFCLMRLLLLMWLRLLHILLLLPQLPRHRLGCVLLWRQNVFSLLLRHRFHTGLNYLRRLLFRHGLN
jgi:hypothetical protein